MSFRILHVDDDPHFRDIVELSLGLDPMLTVMSCGSVDDALVTTADRAPDLILCDVMMPGMDGTAMLARLRESATMAKAPVVFMTACTQTSELEQLKSLGAAAVIIKPFDPMKLAGTVRGHLRSVKLRAAIDGFFERLHTDAGLLLSSREILRSNLGSLVVLERLETCVHKLAGASGVLGFDEVSRAASTLERTIVDRRAGRCNPEDVEAGLDALIRCVDCEIRGSEPNRTKLAVDTADTIAPGRRAPKLLIADDDPAILNILADRCANMGFEVRIASNGIQALIMAIQSEPDILIVDVNMPEANGFDVSARLLNQRSKRIDVVVITGTANPDTIDRCEHLGAFYACKGPELWKNVVSVLAEIVPDVADRINELAMRPMNVEVRTRPRVLIVDDDPDIERFLSSRLDRFGADTLYATDGVQGYRIACQEKPNAIISDYFMPNGDACYLLSRLRSTPEMENIPVFVISGRRLDDLTEQSLAREICGRPGATRSFRKSIDTHELFLALHEVLWLRN